MLRSYFIFITIHLHGREICAEGTNGWPPASRSRSALQQGYWGFQKNSHGTANLQAANSPDTHRIQLICGLSHIVSCASALAIPPSLQPLQLQKPGSAIKISAETVTAPWDTMRAG